MQLDPPDMPGLPEEVRLLVSFRRKNKENGQMDQSLTFLIAASF
jgi:hypothetical protein